MKRHAFGISPLGPSRKVKAAVRKAVSNINIPFYESVEKFERLLFSKFGIKKGNLIIAGSVEELLSLLLRTFMPRRAIIAGPDSGMFAKLAYTFNVGVEFLHDYDNPALSPNAELFASKTVDYDIAYLSNPNNVSGCVIHGLSSGFFRAKDCLIIIDESFIEFAGIDGFIRKAAESENLFVIRTTANYYGLSGLELAYAVASENIIAELQRNQKTRVSILAIEAARAAMKDKIYKKTSAKYFNDEKAFISKIAKRIFGCYLHESDSNIMLLKLPCNANDFIDEAVRNGLAVESCADIQDLDETYIRISVMKHEYNIKLVKLIKKLLAKQLNAVSRNCMESGIACRTK